MNTTLLVLTLGLPLMLVLRVPLAFAIGLATIGALWSADIDMMIFAQRMVSGTQSFSLLAIPFFILAGDLMTAGGISRRLVGFADVLVRHRTGGLGMVAVLAAAFCHGACGRRRDHRADAAALDPDGGLGGNVGDLDQPAFPGGYRAGYPAGARPHGALLASRAQA